MPTALKINNSFSFTIAASQDTDDGRLSESTTTQDDDTTGGMSRDPPKPGSGNQGAVFTIIWGKIKLSNKDLAVDCGSVGYQILHCRQHGGRRGVAVQWEFGAELMYKEARLLGDGKRHWLCKKCHLTGRHKGTFLDASGFRAINGHLRREHNISQDGKPIIIKPGPLKKQPNWVLLQNLTFGQATSAATIAMFQLLRGETTNLFYTSTTSLSKQINDSYCRRQDEIQLLFNGAKSRVHLSSDLWSSTNDLSLLGVIAHFLDALYKHRTVLLGLPRIWGKHSGANQADSILEIATRYGFAGNLGTFVMDNAQNHDTMVEALGRQIPSINSQHRLRCAGHILTLVVKAILYGEGITEFNKTIMGCSDTEAFELWRKFGAIGKVHNTVKYIMRSDQRRQQFISLQGKDDEGEENDDTIFQHAHLLVKDGGGVRWNSTYHMLYRAVQLQTPIERFQERPLDDDAKEVSYSALDDQINADDWREIRQYLTLLGSFVEATHHLEGNAEHEGDEGLHGSIWEVFIWMQTLYSKVTKRLDKLPKSPKTPFRTALEFGKEKMDEYWTKMIYQTPYYYASIILHPDHGVAWFNKHWKGYAPWVKKVKTGMKDFVITYGKTLEGDADSEEEMRAVARKLPDAIVRRREEQRLLGILDSDEERETFALPPAKRRELVAELRTKQL